MAEECGDVAKHVRHFTRELRKPGIASGLLRKSFQLILRLQVIHASHAAHSTVRVGVILKGPAQTDAKNRNVTLAKLLHGLIEGVFGEGVHAAGQHDDGLLALYILQAIHGFSESNLFDAILETVDRLKDVKGKKSIVVLASGVDTFSKHTLDQTMKQLRQSDVTIFCIGLGRSFQNYADTNGGMGSMARMNYLQAENQLKTFSQETGGYSWFPQFAGEMPDVFRDVAAFLRHQYSLSYSPTAGAKDGKFHKVKVELVAPDGGPLSIVDQKGKKQKYQVYAREGYQAPKGGVGD